MSLQQKAARQNGPAAFLVTKVVKKLKKQLTFYKNVVTIMHIRRQTSDIKKNKGAAYMYRSEEVRKLAPEMDPLRLGMGWKLSDLDKPKIMIESTMGDSHPGSAHLMEFVEQAAKGVQDAGGKAARYYTTDICDGTRAPLPLTGACLSPAATRVCRGCSWVSAAATSPPSW